MEVDAEKSNEGQQKPVTNSLAFCWSELVSNLMRSLQDLASYKGVPPEVYLRLGDEEMMVHGALLAALSSWWRKRLDPLLQQVSSFYAIYVVFFLFYHYSLILPIKLSLGGSCLQFDIFGQNFI